MNFIIKTTGLGPTDTKGSRVKAVKEDDTDVMCVDNLYKTGEGLSTDQAHERTAKALAWMVLDGREFSIELVADRSSGYSFRVEVK